MTDDRTRSASGTHRDDPLVPLLQQHGPVPPYDAVEWEALTTRICQAAEEQLAGRRASARRRTTVWPAAPATAVAWWAVTAGWARPAAAAAAAVIAAAILVLATAPSAQSTGAGPGSVVSPSTLTTADAGDTTLLLGTGTAAYNAAIAPAERDSMFSALADLRDQ